MRKLGLFSSFLCLVAPSITRAEPQILSVKKIWDGAAHNAFPDLIRFRNQWFCTFREADTHVVGNGKLRVLTSSDGDVWNSAALLEEKGIDLRDPKLSTTPDGKLMLLAGGSVHAPAGSGYINRRPRVAFSADGKKWGPLQPILADGDWLWRVTWHKGQAWGVSYLGGGGLKTPRAGFLYSSADGVHYEQVAEMQPAGISEVTLRFTPAGEMIALARCEAGDRSGQIGVSKPPYKQWTWRPIGQRLGGPNFLILPDNTMVAGSRKPGDTPTTVIARMDRTEYEPLLTLPSAGDNSYPGLVWHDNLLWVAYYSSHEEKTSVYLAKIRWTR